MLSMAASLSGRLIFLGLVLVSSSRINTEQKQQVAGHKHFREVDQLQRTLDPESVMPEGPVRSASYGPVDGCSNGEQCCKHSSELHFKCKKKCQASTAWVKLNPISHPTPVQPECCHAIGRETDSCPWVDTIRSRSGDILSGYADDKSQSIDDEQNQGLVIQGAAARLHQPVHEPVAENTTRSCPSHTITRPVHILVTRHGLSCANIVDKFSKGVFASKRHIYMLDPLLTEGGSMMTQKAQKEVHNWLHHHNYTIDAVMSSSLARAMETAALQYPGHEVISVPYIRESGYGADNQRAEGELQIDLVASDVSKYIKNPFTRVRINHDWVNAFDGDNGSGDWQKFKDFLRFFFLPNLEKKLNKPNGEPMVLGVVTHSNFMMEGEVSTKCAQHYPKDHKTGRRKANNNQVVSLDYIYTQETPEIECHDSTTKTKLENAYPWCQPVALGTSIYDNKGSTIELCKRDIGEWCTNQIEDKASMKDLKPFVEDQLPQILAKQHKTQEKKLTVEAQIKDMMLAQENAQDNERVEVEAASTKAEKHRIQKLKALGAESVKLAEKHRRLVLEAKSLKRHVCLDGKAPDYEAEDTKEVDESNEIDSFL